MELINLAKKLNKLPSLKIFPLCFKDNFCHKIKNNERKKLLIHKIKCFKYKSHEAC